MSSEKNKAPDAQEKPNDAKTNTSGGTASSEFWKFTAESLSNFKVDEILKMRDGFAYSASGPRGNGGRGRGGYRGGNRGGRGGKNVTKNE